ncbi:MAG: hypothetical protein K5866_09665 [Treponema sp.]|nr:hypothetical protein [Treponema sp.]
MKKRVGFLSIVFLLAMTMIMGCNHDGVTDEGGDSNGSSSEETITLTMNFSGFTIPGGSVSVYYGSEGDNGTYETVAATVNSAGSSATAELKTSLANDYNYFNEIVITVKDSSGNEIATTYTNYFEYSEDGNSLTLTKKTSSTMTVSLVFDDFTAEKVVVTYGASDDEENLLDAEVTIADDNASATAKITNDNINSWGKLYTVAFYADADDTEAISVDFVSNSTGDTGAWFEFAADSTITIHYKKTASGTSLYSKSITADGALLQVVTADQLSALSPASIIIEATDCDWSAVSGDWWLSAHTDESWSNSTTVAWVSDTNYKVEITDSTFISAAQTSGIYVAGTSGMTCTLTVSYTTAE